MSYLSRVASRVETPASGGGDAHAGAPTPLTSAVRSGSPLVEADQRLAMPELVGVLEAGALLGAGLDAGAAPQATPGEPGEMSRTTTPATSEPARGGERPPASRALSPARGTDDLAPPAHAPRKPRAWPLPAAATAPAREDAGSRSGRATPAAPDAETIAASVPLPAQPGQPGSATPSAEASTTSDGSRARRDASGTTPDVSAGLRRALAEVESWMRGDGPAPAAPRGAGAGRPARDGTAAAAQPGPRPGDRAAADRDDRDAAPAPAPQLSIGSIDVEVVPAPPPRSGPSAPAPTARGGARPAAGRWGASGLGNLTFGSRQR
jgi:hypothetical protein